MSQSSEIKEPCWRCCCPTKDATNRKIERRKSVAIAEETLRSLSVAASPNDSPVEIKTDYLPLTFVPNFIIEEIFDDSFKNVPFVMTSDVVIGVADVSGFTSLCESYCEKGVAGIDELASVLNGFMSTLTAMLIEGGADILNFAGDAFLVQWPTKNTSRKKAVKKAYECAVNLQTHQCLQTKNLNGILKIKVGIAIGEIATWILGSSDFLLFVVAGHTVPTVQKAEGFCTGGEIVLAKEVYDLLLETDADLYTPTALEDGFMKIIGYDTNDNMQEPVPKRFELFELCKPEHISSAKIFLIPALRDIRFADELEYLSELTMVTILFIAMLHINVAEPTVLHCVFDIILEACKKFEGVMNKMLLFDKGCTFLVAFGLPGMKHSNDAVRGIYCAENIVQNLGACDIEVSIGITSGTCFCGIVGHPQRQEYTVIGNRVNMAARIMVVYSDESICLNVDTYHLSRDELGHQNFIEMPARKMKGIDSSGTIYAYRKQKKKKQSSVTGSTYDYVEDSQLMSNEKEKSRIYKCLIAMCNAREREKVRLKTLLPVLIIKGAKNTGKNYLMFVAVDMAVFQGYKILLTCAVPSFFDEAFFVVSRLLQHILGITMDESCSEREQKILLSLPKEYHTDLYLFNHLFHVSFPICGRNIDVINRNEKFMKLAKALMHEFFQTHYTLIAIDNADYMDDQSWYLLHQLALEEKVLIVLSLSLDFKEVNVSSSVLLLKAYLHVDTESCQEDIFAPLLCWVLGVKAVHTVLYLFLSEVTQKKVELLKEISLSPVINDCIQIVPFYEIEEERCKKEFYIHHFMALEDEQPMACDLKPGVDLRNIQFPTNINDSVTKSMNNLSLQDRLLLKRASVLGPDFDLHTLYAVSQGMKETDVLHCINNLLSNHIFTSVCTSDGLAKKPTTSRPSVVLQKQNVCFCFNYYLKVSERDKNLSKWHIGSYHRLMFRTYQFRSCILAYMTKEQLYNIRMEVADNLEIYGPECVSCKHNRREAIELKGLGAKEAKSFEDNLEKCCCLEIRSQIYSQICVIYKSIRMMFLPIYFKRKSAQAANNMSFPIQALNYIQLAQEMLPPYESLTDEDKLQEESYFEPLILEVSLKKTEAESFLILGDTYQAATCAFQGLEMLGLDNLCFHGVFDPTQFKRILSRFPLLHAEYVTKITGLLATLYVEAQAYKLAHDILKFEYVALSSYPVDFLHVLNHMTLLYRCKYWMNQRQNLLELEDKIFRLCHQKLFDLDTLLDLVEIYGIGSTYIVIVETNLLLGNFDRGETTANEALKILDARGNRITISEIKILLFHIFYHSKMYSKCFSSLTELHAAAMDEEFGNLKLIACYMTSSMHLIMTHPESVGDLAICTEACNKFASEWEPSPTMRKEMLFYTAVTLSWWCLNSTWNKAKKMFDKCYHDALTLYKEIDTFKDGYWMTTALLYLIRTQLHCLKDQQNFADIAMIRKELNILKEKVKLYYPIYCKMYQKLVKDSQPV